MTASEYNAEREQDVEYQRKRAEFQSELRQRAEVNSKAEQPIVADLRAAGSKVGSVWDLVNASESYPEALPVLLKHLRLGGYPERVMESIGRALAVRPAVVFWSELRTLYLAAESRGEESGLAVALSVAATPDQLGALVSLLKEESRGHSRLLLLRGIKRVGGREGRVILDELKTDPLFGEEARALLR